MDLKHFMNFLDSSRLNMSAVENLKKELETAGFKEINENEKWNLEGGGKYFITKNESSIMAFRLGHDIKKGFSLVGSHSDSPCFRIKQNPTMNRAFAVCLNTEVYGGPLLSTWFDRPLTVEGKVTVKGESALKPKTIHYKGKDGMIFIPSVAIHMNREANKGVEINPQENTLPVCTMDGDFDLIKSIEEEIGEKILSHELYVVSCEKAHVVGVHGEFLMSGRLDNLAMAYANIMALINAKAGEMTAVAYVGDNEEIGSMTKQGAFSPFLRDTLLRIAVAMGGTYEDYRIALSNSFMISSDEAHAFHPNYQNFADPTNRPVIGKGPVIKIAANGAYTSDAVSIAVFKELANEAGVSTQTFHNRSDKRGGSTIASITTSKIDIPIVDVGNPLWGMHSAVETGGIKDQEDMMKIMEVLLSK